MSKPVQDGEELIEEICLYFREDKDFCFDSKFCPRCSLEFAKRLKNKVVVPKGEYIIIERKWLEEQLKNFPCLNCDDACSCDRPKDWIEDFKEKLLGKEEDKTERKEKI